MIAANAYASSGKARRCEVTRRVNPEKWSGNPTNFANSARWSTVTVDRRAEFAGGLVADRLLGADAGQAAHLELRVDLRVAAVRRAERADDAQDERQRDR